MSASDDQTLMNQSNISSIPQTKNVYLIYFFLPFYGILFFLGTFGNGLVITSIVRSSRLRTVTNTYLLNIAIADFLLLLSVPFLIVTVLADGWIFGGTMCKIYFNFIHINQYVSALLLAALSFDRYLAVCHPIRAIEFRTRTKCALIIAGCWLISIFFICPTWIFANVASEKDVKWLGRRVEKCVIDFPAIFPIPPEIVFTYYAFILGFLFPVSMITTFYVLVLIRLNHIRSKHRSQVKQRSHRKVTRIVLAVITAYFICWVPYWLLQIFITIDPLIHSLRLNFSFLPATSSMRFLKELAHLTTILGFSNNCLNPVLYVFLSESFREEYLIVLKCFHPDGFFSRPTIERTISQRTSQIQRVRPSFLRKRMKHSVAIDDASSQTRSISRRSSKRPAEKHQNNKNDENNPRTFQRRSTISIRRSEDQQRTTLLVALSITPNRSIPTILDDGGVYCGF